MKCTASSSNSSQTVLSNSHPSKGNPISPNRAYLNTSNVHSNPSLPPKFLNKPLIFYLKLNLLANLPTNNLFFQLLNHLHFLPSSLFFVHHCNFHPIQYQTTAVKPLPTNAILSSLPWDSLLSSTDVNYSWSMFKEVFIEIMNCTIPSKLVLIKNSPPWANNHLLSCICKHNALFTKAKKAKSSSLMSQYRICRNKTLSSPVSLEIFLLPQAVLFFVFQGLLVSL